MARLIPVLLVAILTWVLPSNSRSQEYLVTAKRLNKVEDPSEMSRWIDVVNTPEGIAIISTVASVIGTPGLGAAVISGIQSIPKSAKDEGEAHWGYIKAPVGYTSCYSYVKDPSVNCNGTFTGVLTTADQSPDRIDGLHWYAVVPRPLPTRGRCWVDGVVVVAFVKANEPTPSGCSPTNIYQPPTWHYGK